MERNIDQEYPYGKFPTKFTKNGQQKYFEQLTNGVEEERIVNTQQTTNSSEQNINSNTQNGFEISKLLPLLKLMGSKKNINSTDMLQLLIPLLGGSDSSQIADIMSLFSGKDTHEEKEEDIEISSSPKIDEYVRVE